MRDARDHGKRRRGVDRALVVAAGATVAAYAGVCLAYFWRVSL